MKLLFTFIVLAICSVSGRILKMVDDWWEYGHFYQIYPRSFKDGNGDGTGDLKGIIENLSYLKTIDVTGVWLSPIFKSPMKDTGYDISDFRNIDPIFGTLDDFEHLMARSRELDIKIILDFVPNHSSDQHEWFKKSCNPNDPDFEKYKDFYVWNNGKLLPDGTRSPPSNWLSVFTGSAWTWVESRQQYYYHQFLPAQPDLNFRNPAVHEEMKEILRYWLRKGVSGFRIDAVPHLYESEENADGVYDDEPLSGADRCEPDEYCYLNHIHTHDLNETFDLVYEWRRVLDEDEFSNQTRILMAEAYSPLELALRYYGRVENGEIVEYGAQMPFNFELMSNTWMETGSYGYIKYIETWLLNLPKGNGIHANWVLGNHDGSRLATRYKPSRTDLFNILLKTLPGITVTYYGEEIGMTDVLIPSGDKREVARTPMQWDSSQNAGFSSASLTWLPVADNFTECNVELQRNLDRSFLKNVIELGKLRRTKTLKYGGLQLAAVDEDVLVYKRQIAGDATADVIAVVLNLGTIDKYFDLTYYLSALPEKMTVSVVSIHSTTINPGDSVETNNLKVPSEVGIVLVGQNNSRYFM
ncbi:maltase A1-like [Sitodiplosis mosellana]|uniref:maltase A1-like n=1 Tax=Sitodiplosis mosellana TaxID=263140 RepID=UPI002444549F|nr:maltase A1-like [Sitodiplosis mosellana]